MSRINPNPALYSCAEPDAWTEVYRLRHWVVLMTVPMTLNTGPEAFLLGTVSMKWITTWIALTWSDKYHDVIRRICHYYLVSLFQRTLSTNVAATILSSSTSFYHNITDDFTKPFLPWRHRVAHAQSNNICVEIYVILTYGPVNVCPINDVTLRLFTRVSDVWQTECSNFIYVFYFVPRDLAAETSLETCRTSAAVSIRIT